MAGTGITTTSDGAFCDLGNLAMSADAVELGVLALYLALLLHDAMRDPVDMHNHAARQLFVNELVNFGNDALFTHG
ncbi:hypothetical protein JP74_21990 [Devosia sp. 17-2-E-8]|nr:hypothetical protein JP74_21990 [Devosia sp. 17-2-E-8]